LQRARHLRSLQKRRTEAQRDQISDYHKLLAKHAAEKKEANAAVKAAKKAGKK
jgi:small subunit ribosomal protein S6e